MIFDFKSIAVCVLGLCLVLVLCRILNKPIAFLLRLGLSCAAGTAVLIIFNFLIKTTGISIALNPLNSLIMGVLGIPGLAVLWALTVMV